MAQTQRPPQSSRETQQVNYCNCNNFINVLFITFVIEQKSPIYRRIYQPPMKVWRQNEESNTAHSHFHFAVRLYCIDSAFNYINKRILHRAAPLHRRGGGPTRAHLIIA